MSRLSFFPEKLKNQTFLWNFSKKPDTYRAATRVFNFLPQGLELFTVLPQGIERTIITPHSQPYVRKKGRCSTCTLDKAEERKVVHYGQVSPEPYIDWA